MTPSASVSPAARPRPRIEPPQDLAGRASPSRDDTASPSSSSASASTHTHPARGAGASTPTTSVSSHSAAGHASAASPAPSPASLSSSSSTATIAASHAPLSLPDALARAANAPMVALEDVLAERNRLAQEVGKLTNENVRIWNLMGRIRKENELLKARLADATSGAPTKTTATAATPKKGPYEPSVGEPSESGPPSNSGHQDKAQGAAPPAALAAAAAGPGPGTHGRLSGEDRRPSPMKTFADQRVSSPPPRASSSSELAPAARASSLASSPSSSSPQFYSVANSSTGANGSSPNLLAAGGAPMPRSKSPGAISTASSAPGSGAADSASVRPPPSPSSSGALGISSAPLADSYSLPMVPPVSPFDPNVASRRASMMPGGGTGGASHGGSAPARDRASMMPSTRSAGWSEPAPLPGRGLHYKKATQLADGSLGEESATDESAGPLVDVGRQAAVDAGAVAGARMGARMSADEPGPQQPNGQGRHRRTLSASSDSPAAASRASSHKPPRPSLAQPQQPQQPQPQSPTSTAFGPAFVAQSNASRPPPIGTPAYSTSSRLPQPLSPVQPGPPSPPTRLTAQLLRYTDVKVSGSNIRHNERGKEVISFFILVELRMPLEPTTPTQAGPRDAPGEGAGSDPAAAGGGGKQNGAGGGQQQHQVQVQSWKIEKLYSDVLLLDQRIKQKHGRSATKRMGSLPDKGLFKDHAPNKVDQRKQILESYLQSLLAIQLQDKDDFCTFLSTDVVPAPDAARAEAAKDYKEGFLTKKGQNLGRWVTRFYKLQGARLEYYESRGGAHLGSILIANAQIGRQQKSPGPEHDENSYRHAFLILEKRGGAGGAGLGEQPQLVRHVLCAESDQERDEWVEVLVRVIASIDRLYQEAKAKGLENDAAMQQAQLALQQQQLQQQQQQQQQATIGTFAQQQLSGPPLQRSNSRSRKGSRTEEIIKGPAQPMYDLVNNKLFQTGPMPAGGDPRPSSAGHGRTMSIESVGVGIGVGAADQGPEGAAAAASNGHVASSMGPPSSTNVAKKLMDRHGHGHGHGHHSGSGDLASSASLPTNLDAIARNIAEQREQYLLEQQARSSAAAAVVVVAGGQLNGSVAPPGHRSMSSDSLTPVGRPATPVQRVQSPDSVGSGSASGSGSGAGAHHHKPTISGPMNGAPIPTGYKFGGKDEPTVHGHGHAHERDREKKTGKGRFWDKGWFNKESDKSAASHQSRPVFGVPLEESIAVSSIAEGMQLPSVVYRCIEYLEKKNASSEEGIYRLSGSSAVIKALKDRFNVEGDVNLLAGGEYYDPHAIAGLLKTFLRDLPSSVLTRELHMEFMRVNDIIDRKERVNELGQLVSMLPLANYSLLRTLCSHLIKIIENADVNKMTMRNVGIVFSPTLGIPAGVFSLFLTEFDYIFFVDAVSGEPAPKQIEDDVPEMDPYETEQANAGAASSAAAAGSNRQLQALGASPRQQYQTLAPDGGHVDVVNGQLLRTGGRGGNRHSFMAGAAPPVFDLQQRRSKRNSIQYSDSAAEKLLGLQGRSLKSADEGDSDLEGADAEVFEEEPDPESDVGERFYDDEGGAVGRQGGSDLGRESGATKTGLDVGA